MKEHPPSPLLRERGLRKVNLIYPKPPSRTKGEGGCFLSRKEGIIINKLHIREIIIVEGRYDKNAVLQVVNATVLETRGFGIFRDPKLRALLVRMAKVHGVVILTDSDGAGFLIRSKLKGMLPPDTVKHAYIPDVYGKERRKATSSREGKLGVEGMPPDVLLKALTDAGAGIDTEPRSVITKADFYEWGLSGRQDSAVRRKELQKKLHLPERLTANALLEICCLLYSVEEIKGLILPDR